MGEMMREAKHNPAVRERRKNLRKEKKRPNDQRGQGPAPAGLKELHFNLGKNQK